MLTKSGSVVTWTHELAEKDLVDIDDTYKQLAFGFNGSLESVVNSLKLIESEVNYSTIPFTLKKVAYLVSNDDVNKGFKAVYYTTEEDGCLIKDTNGALSVYDIRYTYRVLRKHLVVCIDQKFTPDLLIVELDGFSINVETTLIMDRLITMIQYVNNTILNINAGVSIARSNTSYGYAGAMSLRSDNESSVGSSSSKTDFVSDVVTHKSLAFGVGSGSIALDNESVESIIAHRVDLTNTERSFKQLTFAEVVVFLNERVLEGTFTIPDITLVKTTITTRIPRTQKPFKPIEIGVSNDVEIYTYHANGRLFRRIINKKKEPINVCIVFSPSEKSKYKIPGSENAKIHDNNMILPIPANEVLNVSLEMEEDRINIY